MLRSRKLLTRRIRRYFKNKKGTVAIEFAILAIPFFMLIFAILELAVVFFIHSTLNHAINEAARQMRIGSFQACGGTQQDFKDLVCDNMVGLGDCDKRLRLDVVSQSSFSSISLVPPPPPNQANPSNPSSTDDIQNGAWSNTTANAPVVIRGLYYHKLVLPTQLTRLENINGTGIRMLVATTAFKNEPFPAGGVCP